LKNAERTCVLPISQTEIDEVFVKLQKLSTILMKLLVFKKEVGDAF